MLSGLIRYACILPPRHCLAQLAEVAADHSELYAVAYGNEQGLRLILEVLRGRHPDAYAEVRDAWVTSTEAASAAKAAADTRDRAVKLAAVLRESDSFVRGAVTSLLPDFTETCDSLAERLAQRLPGHRSMLVARAHPLGSIVTAADGESAAGGGTGAAAPALRDAYEGDVDMLRGASGNGTALAATTQAEESI